MTKEEAIDKIKELSKKINESRPAVEVGLITCPFTTEYCDLRCDYSYRDAEGDFSCIFVDYTFDVK